MKKTKLDLYRSAEQCAVDSLTQNNSFAVSQFAMARFESESLNQADWDYWNGVFTQSRQSFAQLKTQPSLSPVATT